MENIYPLTIIKDRYQGTYSGGKYLAFNKYPFEINSDVFSDDVSCHKFWLNFENRDDDKKDIGVGETIQEAIDNLSNYD